MPNIKISDLNTLGKNAFANTDYIPVARGTSSNVKVQIDTLLPTLTNVGSGGSYLLSLANQNAFSQKALKVTGSILQLTPNADDLTLSINQGSIDLNACNNANALFLKTVDLSSNNVTNTLPTIRGGTGLSSFAAKSVFISHPSTANTMQALQMSGNGQLLIGGTTGPKVTTLTNGNNITITNGDGTIQIAATIPSTVVTKSENGIVLTDGGGLTSAGNITFSDSTKGLVYGNKNTVNQATNLSTGVLINATAGKINLVPTAVTSETQYEFTVTNSAVTADSLVFVTLVGPGASAEANNAYLHVHVSAISSGSFKIVLSNPYQTHSVDAGQRSVQFLVIN